jgi:hypothetical protein
MTERFMKTYRIIFFAFIASAVCASPAEAVSQRAVGSRVPVRANSQANAKPKVYVAPFTLRGNLDPKIAASITNEFERAMVRQSCYEVLERIDVDQLVKQARNERSIATVNDLGKDITGKLRLQGANAVIFGEADEDVNSGEVVFIAKMEYFNSTIAWERASSLSRGLVYDRTSRITPIKKLTDGLCPGQPSEPSSPGQAASPAPAQSPSMLRGLAHGFEIQLRDCRRAGQSVTCYLTVTNQNDFRAVVLSPGGTEIYDSKSRAFQASQASLAGIRHGGNIEAKLLQNRPAEATVTFETVPLDVTEIYLMIINMYEGGYGFQVRLSGTIQIR